MIDLKGMQMRYIHYNVYLCTCFYIIRVIIAPVSQSACDIGHAPPDEWMEELRESTRSRLTIGQSSHFPEFVTTVTFYCAWWCIQRVVCVFMHVS